MPTSIWVAELWISDKVAGKIDHKHKLKRHDVNDAVLCEPNLQFKWGRHPETDELRALVQTTIRNKRCIIVLYPVEDRPDTWSLGSAYFV